MFGAGSSVPVPDVDRTDHLLILGANPLASNGSLLTAPDMRGRLRGDPRARRQGRRHRPAPLAHRRACRRAPLHPARHRRAAAVRASSTCCSTRASCSPARAGRPRRTGIDEVEGARRRLHARRRRPAVRHRRRRDPADGARAGRRRRAPRSTAASAPARRSSARSRAGWSTSSTCSPATSTARAARCSPRPPPARRTRSGEPGRGRGVSLGRWASRVRGLPEAFGELPVACLAEEIETPGEGQVRALITIAGNPCVSTPNSERLSAALESLDFMVSVDIYVNETTRHADVILPGPSPLERPHYDLALYQLAVRNVANWSPAVYDSPGEPPEWQIAAAPHGHRHRTGAGRRRRGARRLRRADARPARVRDGRLAGIRPRPAGADGHARAARGPGAARST